jgi:nuclear pore complex protein Nup85
MMCFLLLGVRCFRGVVAEITEDMPVDPTSPEDQLYAALFASDPTRVARLANDIDIWLVTHMVDMLETLGLPEHSTLV